MTAVALTILVGGLTILFVSLPLIYRKVPMNHLYGIRIEEAFQSDERWYAVNAYGGRQLARWSALIIACGTAGFFVPEKYFLHYAWASVPVTLAAVLIPVCKTMNWSASTASTRTSQPGPE